MAAHALSLAERIAWLRLARTESVGPITFRHLIGRFGGAAAALDALPGLARRGGRARPPRIPDRAEAEREIAALDRMGARLVALGEPDYPLRLAAIDDPPPVLALHGDAAFVARPCVAVVGARNASAAGRRMAAVLAEGLGRAGVTVVSGLARGIDGAAHRAALDHGTIAAVAGGLDQPYPPEHAELQAEIARRGLVLSEQPPGTAPLARHFPRRNRIVAGLAQGVVVVEAAEHSGSLITARLALGQGRELFAVPGSPLDPRCRGANALIRDGAMLVQGADDVLEALAGLDGGGLRRPPVAAPERPIPGPAEAEPDLAEARPRLEVLLGPTPIAIDELIRQAQVSPAAAQAFLLEAELAGRLQRLAGGKVAILPE